MIHCIFSSISAPETPAAMHPAAAVGPISNSQSHDVWRGITHPLHFADIAHFAIFAAIAETSDAKQVSSPGTSLVTNAPTMQPTNPSTKLERPAVQKSSPDQRFVIRLETPETRPPKTQPSSGESPLGSTSKKGCECTYWYRLEALRKAIGSIDSHLASVGE